MTSVITQTSTVASVVGPTRPHLNVRALPWDIADDRPYGQLAAETLERMKNGFHSGISSRVDAVRRTFVHRKSLNTRFDLWSHQWALSYNGNDVGTARMVLIQGQRTEIINTWIFPTYPSNLPVFAAELISMGGQQRLSFIDIQAPGYKRQDYSLAEQVRSTADLFKDARIDEQPPPWAITDTLGHYFFRRTGDASLFPFIAKAYLAYMDVLTNTLWPSLLKTLLIGASPKSDFISQRVDASMQTLRDYQHHHLVSSPGNPFLSKLFGEQWTDCFLHEFLFSQP